MRRILFYILPILFLSVTIQSCAEEVEGELPTPNPNPNPNPNPSPTVVAKWKKIGITDVQGADIAYHDHECSTIYDYLQFSSNGTAKDVSYLQDCVTTEEDTGTYTVSGNTLTMVANDPNGNLTAGDLTILELTNSSLRLKVEPLDFVIIFEKY